MEGDEGKTESCRKRSHWKEEEKRKDSWKRRIYTVMKIKRNKRKRRQKTKRRGKKITWVRKKEKREEKKEIK